VLVGAGALAQLERSVTTLAPGRRPVIITDRNVARAVPLSVDWPRLVVPPGERSKSRARWAELSNQLLKAGFGRDTVIVAVGGGVVGDLAGFVAATFLRGVPCFLVPTSLVAMVDASVGGKTGVNAPAGKNLIGVFHPPIGVLIDPRVTVTLDPVGYRGGLVEALKHGLVADAGYYRWIVRSASALRARDPAALARLIRWSVAIKAAIVSRDERETGLRAVLNAGHSVGHAIEQATRYRVPHGDAVALGLVTEGILARRRRRLSAAAFASLIEDLRAVGAPLRFPAGGDRALLRAIRVDKKNRAGELRFALARGVGAAARGSGPWTVHCSETDVRQALAEARRRL
jgi:3-dehydroquinate synthase